MSGSDDESSVPSLDRQIGIESYSTKFKGVGGRIRRSRSDFLVEEVLDSGTRSKISEKPSQSNRYPVYRLMKEGVDTLHALQQVEKRLGWQATYLGLKDADAKTVQYISPKGLRGGDAPVSVEVSAKVSLKLEGYLDGLLTRRSLAGNRFTIRVVDVQCGSKVVEAAGGELKRAVEELVVPNFFGYQRFGAKRPVNHLVGRELLRGRFEEAVMTFLTYPSIGEDAETLELREGMQNPARYPSLLEHVDRRMDIERRMMEVLISHPGDWIRVLRSVPLTVRRLFINSYQAFLFNKVVSEALKEEGVALTEADEDNDVYGVIGSDEKSSSGIRRGRKNLVEKLGEKVLPLIQMVGYAYRAGGGRFDRITQKVLVEEDVTPRMFYIKEMPELSMEGGFRTPSLLVDDLEVKTEPEESACLLRFNLAKGSYATVLLRELMKPSDPVSAGF